MGQKIIATLLILIIILGLIFFKLHLFFPQQNLVTPVEYISKEIGPRPAGSSNEEKTAQYLASQFKKYGVDTEIQQFKYYSLNSEDIKTSENVVGTIKGFSSQEIIICADLDSSKDQLIGNYTEGANDDVTSLVVLIGLAEKYKHEKPYYTIKLVAFGAGEDGFTYPLITPKRTSLSPDAYYKIVYLPYLVGARHYILNHQDDVSRTIAVISLEAVGIGDPCVVSKDAFIQNEPRFLNFLVFNALLYGIHVNKIDFMAFNNTMGGEYPISHVYLPFSFTGTPSTFITCMQNPQITAKVHTEIPGYLSVDDNYEHLLRNNNDSESLNKQLNKILKLVDISIRNIYIFEALKIF